MSKCSRIMLAACLLAVFSGCQQTGESQSHSQQDLTGIQQRDPGVWEETLKTDDFSQNFAIHVPQGYDAEVKAPLILALHYGGRVTPWYGKGFLEGLVQPALAELNAIIVAPDSLGGSWDSDQNDQAVPELLRQVREVYSIDESKTLVVGFSMGGHGAYYFAGNYPELFQAAIPMAARLSQQVKQAEWKMPLHVVHSRKDSVVPFGPAEEYVKAEQAKGTQIDFLVLEDLDHYNVPAYADSLKSLIPWIQESWADP